MTDDHEAPPTGPDEIEKALLDDANLDLIRDLSISDHEENHPDLRQHPGAKRVSFGMSRYHNHSAIHVHDNTDDS